MMALIDIIKIIAVDFACIKHAFIAKYFTFNWGCLVLFCNISRIKLVFLEQKQFVYHF